MPKKGKRGPGKRYSAADKQRILTAAKKDSLTGEQVQKRFGVSTLTFYRWRGPVRGRKTRSSVSTRGRSGASNGAIREEIRASLRRMLPQVIREEVAAAVKDMLA